MLTEAFKTYPCATLLLCIRVICSSSTKCFLCDFLPFFSFIFSLWMECYYHPLQMQQTYFSPSLSESSPSFLDLSLIRGYCGTRGFAHAWTRHSTWRYLIWITEAESASELFHRQLVSTHLKSNRRDTGSRKSLFLLFLLSMLLWSQLNCLQNKGFYLKLTMSGLVSVQNTVDTGHEDMIVSWLSPNYFHYFQTNKTVKCSYQFDSCTWASHDFHDSTVKEFMWQLKGLFRDTLDGVFSLWVLPKMSTLKMSTPRMSTPKKSTPRISTSQNINSQNVNS